MIGIGYRYGDQYGSYMFAWYSGTALLLRCNQPLREMLGVIYGPAKIGMKEWVVSDAYNNGEIILPHG